VLTRKLHEDQQLLRVEEIARILQITPRTIYRWLHEKKMEAKKIGRAWYIPKEVVSRLSSGHSTSHSPVIHNMLLPLKHGEHLLALAPERNAVAGFMARLIEMGLQKKHHIFAGCWPFTPDDLRKIMRTNGIPTDALEAESILTIADFSKIYNADGAEGILHKWRELVDLSQRSATPLLAIGAPSLDCWGNNLDSLIEFEQTLATLWRVSSSVSVCIYPLSDFVPDRLRRIGSLINVHTGTLLWSETKLILLRQEDISPSFI